QRSAAARHYSPQLGEQRRQVHQSRWADTSRLPSLRTERANRRARYRGRDRRRKNAKLVRSAYSPRPETKRWPWHRPVHRSQGRRSSRTPRRRELHPPSRVAVFDRGATSRLAGRAPPGRSGPTATSPIFGNREKSMSNRRPLMTHATGAPVADNLNIMTAGPRGPALLQDIWLIEKMAHFDREVIPERRMHAKGWGAYGTFTVTHDITRYTKARIFSRVGKKTPMFARFSTVAGERGAADAERDIRGFALRFYTEEGNWDIVGNNTPVFFFRDPLRFPDLNHAIKRDPRTGLRSADNNWDFWSLLPEALHQVTIVMSDRGIPKSFRHMHGFGSHTFSMINAANERVWVKFHFRTRQGVQNLTDEEAAALVANDRETHGRDLLAAIERGDF